MFQCDLMQQMKEFNQIYFSSLNSPDLYDLELPMKKSRCFGGTMALWRREHDPYISIHRVATSAFLPLIFDPPNLPLTIHLAIYLPTAGRDSEFVEELAALDACIIELYEKYPDAIFFLRGDFNASKTNHTRTGLLNYFITSHSFISLDIPHPTYHHFVGDGSSDSHLDRIFHSESIETPEKLSRLHCKLSNPLIESHHDILISTVELEHTVREDFENNIVAPKVENTRTRVAWSEAGIEAYKALVVPKLQLIQETWFNTPNITPSIMSLGLQSTNTALVESACETNRTIYLGQSVQPRPCPLRKKVRMSQIALLKHHTASRKYEGPCEYLVKLDHKLKQAKAKHRQLLRSLSATDSLKRDTLLHEILDRKSFKSF